MSADDDPASGIAGEPALTGVPAERITAVMDLPLGTAVALFVVGAEGDGWGLEAGSRKLPPLLFPAAVFYLATGYADGDFTVFVGFEASGLPFALAVYTWLAVSRHRPGATQVAVGILLSLVGAGSRSCRQRRPGCSGPSITTGSTTSSDCQASSPW